MKLRNKVLLFVAAAMLFSSISVSAADSNITFLGGSDGFVFSQKDKNLFENFSSVMPGDSLDQKITIKNDIKNKKKVKIYLRAEIPDDANKDFLDQLILTVSANKGKELYSANAGDVKNLSENNCLGTFYSGADVCLNATLEVPSELSNDYSDQVGKINWIFTAEELPIEAGDPSPKTGDTTKIGIVLSVFALSGLGITLILRNKYKKNAAPDTLLTKR